jgi:hypothetical protein
MPGTHPNQWEDCAIAGVTPEPAQETKNKVLRINFRIKNGPAFSGYPIQTAVGTNAPGAVNNALYQNFHSAGIAQLRRKKRVLSSWFSGSNSVTDIYTTYHENSESLASASGCRPAHAGVERDAPLPRLAFVQLSRSLLGDIVQTLPVRVTPLVSDAVTAGLIYQWPGSFAQGNVSDRDTVSPRLTLLSPHALDCPIQANVEDTQGDWHERESGQWTYFSLLGK